MGIHIKKIFHSILLAALSLVLILVLFGKGDNGVFEHNSNLGAVPYDYILTDSEALLLLKDNTETGSTVKVCSPVFAYELDVERDAVQKHTFEPYDLILFPVLENNKIIGFITYYYENGNAGVPRFRKISEEMYKALKKETLKIAHARWQVPNGACNVGYAYISGSNEVGSVFDSYGRTTKFNADYDILDGLYEIYLKSLEAVITFENKSLP